MASSTISQAVQTGDRRRKWIFAALLILTALVVHLPALRAQFILDDYLHASMIDGTFPAKRDPFNLYDFVNEADRPALTERGMLPWWSHPRLKVRFFRPLPSALRWADHRIFGRFPLLLHLHSMAWWAAAVLAARALYKRFLAQRPQRFATAIFALAPCHALPLAWLANREALISLSLGLFALGAYVRFREERRARDAALAAVLFAFSMSGGEYAMCMGGYVLAYELVARGDRFFRRVLGLMPFVVPAILYLAVRAKLGYGTEGSGFYSDPFREPAAFFASAPRRLLTLLAQGWFSLDGESLTSTTPWWLLALLAIGAVAFLAWPLRRAFAALEDAPRRTAAWMLLGSVLSLLPVLAVVPSPRLVGASIVGVAAAVAILFEHAWFPAEIAPRRGLAELTGFAALALGFAHLVHGPGTAWLIGWNYKRSSEGFAVNAQSLRASVASAARDDVYVVRGMGGSFFMPFALDPRGAPPPHWRILAMASHVLALRRDARTLDLIAPKGQGLFPGGSGNLFRDESSKMKVGQRFEIAGLRTTILDVGPQGPRSARFELDTDLEAAPHMWLTETSTGFTEAVLPAPGFGQPLDH
ncbi:Hypothetical protein A7982_05206 [Minicystis rosea]|nr:Hypothetical protein A7982_05206 [Minicystis rosea]